MRSLKDNTFSVRCTVANNTYIGSPHGDSPLSDMIRRDLANALAEKIIRSSSLVIKREEFCTTFQMDVMVLSPNELYSVARELAETLEGLRPGNLYTIQEVRSG